MVLDEAMVRNLIIRLWNKVNEGRNPDGAAS
jgi:hypothetical protein